MATCTVPAIPNKGHERRQPLWAAELLAGVHRLGLGGPWLSQRLLGRRLRLRGRVQHRSAARPDVERIWLLDYSADDYWNDRGRTTSSIGAAATSATRSTTSAPSAATGPRSPTRSPASSSTTGSSSTSASSTRRTARARGNPGARVPAHGRQVPQREFPCRLGLRRGQERRRFDVGLQRRLDVRRALPVVVLRRRQTDDERLARRRGSARTS